MASVRWVVCLFAISLLAACGSGSSSGPDSGAPDSGPAIVCNAPQTACGSTCVDLTSSPDQCGACGHSCQGEPCVGGQCQPEALTSNDQPAPERLTASDGYVYWSSSIVGELRRVPTDGGAVEPLLTGRTNPLGLAVRSGALWWVEGNGGTGGGLFSQTLDGGAVVPVDTATLSHSLVLIGDRVIWNTASSVRAEALDGGDVVELGQDAGRPLGLAYSDPWIIWGTQAGVLARALLDGGQAAPIAPANVPTRIVVAHGTVYWTGVSVGASTDAGVFSVSIDGGAVRKIAALGAQKTSFNTIESGLAIDDAFIYWSDLATGTIFRAPLDGGAPEPFVTGQDAPDALLVDGPFLYWSTVPTSDGGTIHRVAR